MLIPPGIVSAVLSRSHRCSLTPPCTDGKLPKSKRLIFFSEPRHACGLQMCSASFCPPSHSHRLLRQKNWSLKLSLISSGARTGVFQAPAVFAERMAGRVFSVLVYIHALFQRSSFQHPEHKRCAGRPSSRFVRFDSEQVDPCSTIDSCRMLRHACTDARLQQQQHFSTVI